MSYELLRKQSHHDIDEKQVKNMNNITCQSQGREV